MFGSNILPDIPENEIQINIETNKKIQDLPSFVTEIDNDILSVTDTSCSYGDLSLNLGTRCNVQPSLERSTIVYDCLEKYTTSNADIGNVSVQSSADVTFGNKTFFNGPVVIKHFVASDGEQNSDPPETKTEQHNWKSFDCLRKRPLLIGTILTAFVVVVIALIVTGYFLIFYDNKATPMNETICDDPINDNDYKFINRSQYGATQSKERLDPICLPAKVIIVGRTLTADCTNYSECVDRILQLQRYHMTNKSWDDIGWNFLVGGDGKAYEGSGWYTISAFPNKYCMISVSFIGNFSDYEAPVKQLYAAQRFIEDGIRMNLIHPEYILHASKNLVIESKFNLLYDQIIVWSSVVLSKVVHINQ